MKKILTLTALILLTSVMTVWAQTSASTFGITTLCEPLSKSGSNNYSIPNAVYKKMLDLKSDKAIYSSLIKAGFSCTSKRNVTEYDGGLEEYVTYLKAKYSKAASVGTIYVDQDGRDITITFPNMAEKNRFLQTVKAEQTKGYIYSSSQYYWVGVRIETSSNSFTLRIVANGGY